VRCQPGTLAHRKVADRIERSRIAALPDGDLAEIVIDSEGDAWTRWHSDGSWSACRHAAHAAEDADICAFGAGALVSLVTWAAESHSMPVGTAHTSGGHLRVVTDDGKVITPDEWPVHHVPVKPGEHCDQCPS
jgi:hypothetical protein